MSTVYSNTRHPKLVKWSVIAIIIVCFICLVISFLIDDNSILHSILWGAFNFLFFPVFFTLAYSLNRIIVDEEADTISLSWNKKYPLKISSLSYISYKESKKGRFRSLFIHDNGTGFMNINTTKKNADLIVAQLTKINPTIEIKHVNYL